MMHRSAKVLPAVVIFLVCIIPPVFNVRVRRKLVAARSDPPGSFSKTLTYAQNVMMHNRPFIFKAACDSSVFTCGEIIQLTNTLDETFWGFVRWSDTILLFAYGRNHSGCISDPENAQSIIDAFEDNWKRKWSIDPYTHNTPPDYMAHYETTWNLLKSVFLVGNSDLKRAKGIVSLHMQLQTDRRTDEAIEKLLADAKLMMGWRLSNRQRHWNVKSILAMELADWLKRVRSHGEQFTGPQLVHFVQALSVEGLSWPVSVALNHLEQCITGVTCQEVIMILSVFAKVRYSNAHQDQVIAGLTSLKSNIIDGQNKASILADTLIQNVFGITDKMETVLRDVGVGLPPKNNPVFGVVKGNPVIFVVDESDSMDVNFTLGNVTFTRRTFCHSQLEVVLKGLPSDTYFNVIQYSSSAVKVFQNPILVSQSSTDAAMDKVSVTWRDHYAPGRNPVTWLRKVHGFSLEFKHKFKGNRKNPMEALQLAYATINVPLPQASPLHGPLAVTEHWPQIYLLTSGLPDGGAHQILNKIDEFDSGRHIPINSIVFGPALPADLTKQFGKDLASKSGGFFRSIEQT